MGVCASNARVSPSGTACRVGSHSEFVALSSRREWRCFVLFIGYGSAQQFGDVQAVRAALVPHVAVLNDTYGRGGWVGVFGGDPYTDGVNDIGAVMYWLKHEHGVPLYAIASDVLVGWGGVDSHVDAVQYVATDYHQEECGGKEVTVWGGRHPVTHALAGSTKAYLAPPFTADSRFGGVVALGGGAITAQELHIAREAGVRTLVLDCAFKNPAAGAAADAPGPVGAWVIENGIAFNEWR